MKRLLSRWLATAATALLAANPLPLHAEHRYGHTDESDFLTDLPVVLSASRLAQPLSDAPSAVTVIDRETIKASGAREIADLFRLVPGFQVSSANGANPVVNYHGLTGQYNGYLQVLVDGRSYYSPGYLGTVNWNMLPVSMDDIERIEVVRGSNSATYGANSFLGVANIITRDPGQSRGGLVSASLGNQGIRDNLFRYGGTSGELDYRFSAGRREDSGFNGINDSKHVSFFNFRGDLRLNPQDMMQIQFGANENSTGFGSATSLSGPLRTQLASHYFGQLQWRRALSQGEELSITGYHIRDGGVESYTAFMGPIPVPIDWGRRTERTNVELQHILRPHDDMRLVWGLEHRLDRVSSKFTFNTADWQETSLSRAFGNLEWRLRPWLLVNAGAMVEHYSLSGTDVSPRVMLNFQPNRDHTIRIGVSKAVRTPSLMEDKSDVRLYSSTGVFLSQLFKSQALLRPERIYAREVSYLGEIRPYGLTLDARFFDEHISDMVTTKPLVHLSDTRTFLNAYQAHLRGVEYEARWRPLAGTTVSLIQSFVRILGMEKLESADSTPGDTMQSAPNHRTTLFVSSRLPEEWQASLTHSWVGAMVWPAEGDPVPKYRRLDLRLAKTFRTGGYKSELALTTQNVFGPYSEFRPEFKFTRRSFVTYSLEY